MEAAWRWAASVFIVGQIFIVETELAERLLFTQESTRKAEENRKNS